MERPEGFSPGEPSRPAYRQLFVDTSGIVKLYIREEGSEIARRAVGEAWTTHASSLAYPEARSAFARLRREGSLDDESLAAVVEFLKEDWQRAAYNPVVPLDWVCRLAGRLAEKHALRAYDAMQLASALRLRSAYAKGPAGDVVRFLTFDARLRRAAEAEGLLSYEPPTDDDGGDAGGDPGERP